MDSSNISFRDGRTALSLLKILSYLRWTDKEIIDAVQEIVDMENESKESVKHVLSCYFCN